MPLTAVTNLIIKSYVGFMCISCATDMRSGVRYAGLEGTSGGSDSKEPASNAGDAGSILGSGRSPGKGNGNPLQYPCLENPMDRGAWWATVHGVAKSRTQLSD